MTETIEPMPAHIDQQQLAHDLVEVAREGIELIGPGGLLTGLTKTGAGNRLGGGDERASGL